jgi:hypothetical protein
MMDSVPPGPRFELSPMIRHLLAAAVLVMAGESLAAAADQRVGGIPGDRELAREPSWSPPAIETIRRRAAEWAAGQSAAAGDPEATVRVAAIWDRFGRPDGGGDVIDAAMQTVAAVDPRAAAVNAADEPPGPAAAAWLDSFSAADFGRQAVRLWLGRELVRTDRFDEALPLLADLDVAASIDPATLLFLRGCCQHWLLEREAAIESLERLLEREREIPARYAGLARLLRADIEAVESDSLDHIARRMRDVRRRLDLGHAGPEIRKVQQGVIDSLDTLIAKLEQQQQDQGQAGSAGGGGAEGQGGAAGQPMEDSQLAGGKGKGEVQKRDLGDGEGWGDLPPHEREAALQQIGREYPPYYREAIEQYFKRLATGAEDAP